ncbi:hypothetical protein M3J43_26765, partial [Escherichia coli]|uniref:hypothetical protein n=1 Tax=Escherichia coli TaxID=562 RepID=UPI00200EF28C
GIFVDKNWYWIGVAALIGYMFLFNFLFVLFLEWLDPLGKGQTTVSEEALKEKEANRMGANMELEDRGSAGSSANGSGEIKRQGTRKKGMVLPFTPLS